MLAISGVEPAHPIRSDREISRLRNVYGCTRRLAGTNGDYQRGQLWGVSVTTPAAIWKDRLGPQTALPLRPTKRPQQGPGATRGEEDGYLDYLFGSPVFRGGECWIPVPLAPPAPSSRTFAARFRLQRRSRPREEVASSAMTAEDSCAEVCKSFGPFQGLITACDSERPRRVPANSLKGITAPGVPDPNPWPIALRPQVTI